MRSLTKIFVPSVRSYSAFENQRISASAHQRISASAHQRISASAHQRISASLILSIIFTVSLTFAQTPTLQINSVNPIGVSNPGLDGGLNGISRNHFVGFTNETIWNDYKPWETKLKEKFIAHRDINVRFGSGGSEVYRLGHNISDGNFNAHPNPANPGSVQFSFCDFSVTHPGWHWATDYKDGNFKHQFAVTDPLKLDVSAQSDCFDGKKAQFEECKIYDLKTNTWFLCADTETRRFGAGVHRFFYTVNKDGIDKFSGFTLNINYKNSISGIVCPVKSGIGNAVALVSPGGQVITPNFVRPTASTTNGQQITAVQISGPPPGSRVSEGCYLIEYKFQNGDDVSYCGFVFAVSTIGSDHVMVPKSQDMLLEIDLQNAPPTLGARERHSLPITIYHHKVRSSTYQERVAWQVYPVGYDDITEYIQEAGQLQADLGIVLNIGTGFPQEAVGLLEYLAEPNINGTSKPSIEYVELGSELMGDWNKGSVRYDPIVIPPQGAVPAVNRFFLNPTELGALTMPFARAIKTSSNPVVANTPIAATSSYNFSFDFVDVTSNSLSIAEKVRLLLNEHVENNRCYIDLLNIHNYPTNGTVIRPFTPEKVDKMLAINSAFGEKVMKEIADGIKQSKNPQGHNISFIMSESNTGDRSGTAHNIAQHLTMTEAMYFAETFRICAEKQFKALTPFALLKPNNFSSGFSNPSNGDPLAQGFGINDDPDNNILFYPNNEGLPYSDVYRRPLFRAKKMIVENLEKLIPDYSLSSVTHTNVVIDGYDGDAPYKNPTLTVLPTMSVDKEEFFVLVVNKDQEKSQYLRITLDNEDVTNAELICLQGGDPNVADYLVKNPDILDPSLSGYNLNMSSPLFGQTSATNMHVTSATLVNGAIVIPRFSICILKFRKTPPPGCSTILSPIDGAALSTTNPTITWGVAQNAIGYTLVITDKNGVSTSIPVGNTTSYTLAPNQSLKPCQAFQIQVQPTNGNLVAQGCPIFTWNIDCCVGCQNFVVHAPSTSNPTVFWPVAGYDPAEPIGEIRVVAPANLNIPMNNRLEFCKNGILIVEPGAGLANNGTLTACSNEWKGIVMPEGLNNKGQAIGGSIIMLPNSKIEHAIIGIDYRIGTVRLEFGADNNLRPKFTNCRIGIRNNPVFYQTYPRAVPTAAVGLPTTISGFFLGLGGYFTVDDNYKVSSPFSTHLELVDAPTNFRFAGVGTHFLNKMTSPPLVNHGIIVSGSNIEIQGGGDDENHTIFKGHTIGIQTSLNRYSVYSTLGQPVPPIIPFYRSDRRTRVKGVVFKECAVGIFDRISSANLYRGNIFRMGKLSQAYRYYLNSARPTQIGISAENNVWAFTITDNYFIRDLSGILPIFNLILYGTNLVKLGMEENLVYKNNFMDMSTSNLASDVNGELVGTKGLRYECNTMGSRDYDIRALAIGTGLNLTEPVLRKDQGFRTDVDEFTAVGNCFTDPIQLPGSTRQITYGRLDQNKLNYYWLPATQASCLPEPTEVSLVNVLTTGQGLIVATNSCADRIIPGGESRLQLESAWTSVETNQNRLAYFEAKQELENANDPAQRNFFKQQKDHFALFGYMAAINDTTQHFDSTLIWLDRINSWQADLTKAELLLSIGEQTQGYNLLDQISIHHQLDTESQIQVEGVKQVYSLLQNMNQENQQVKLAELELIAQNPYHFGSAMARNVLQRFGHHFPPILPLELETSERSIQATLHSTSIKPNIVISPNPVSDILNYEIGGVEFGLHKFRIQVLGALGSVVVEQEADAKFGTIQTAHLPKGYYVLALYQDEMLISHARFTTQ
jgi:hypothetical protein